MKLPFDIVADPDLAPSVLQVRSGGTTKTFDLQGRPVIDGEVVYESPPCEHVSKATVRGALALPAPWQSLANVGPPVDTSACACEPCRVDGPHQGWCSVHETGAENRPGACDCGRGR